MGSPYPSASLTQLIQALVDGPWQQRMAASKALLTFGAAAVEPLLALLEDGSPRVADARPDIIATLGLLGDTRALAPLIAQLRASRAETRQAAVNALANLRDPTAIAPLIGLFRHDEQARGDEAGAASVWNDAANALAVFGDRALPSLLTAIRDPHDNVRAWSALALGLVGGDAALGALRSALADSNAQVRAQAADALGLLADQGAFAALARALSADPDPFVRARAVYALAALPGVATVNTLLPALRDPDSGVRCAAAYAIGCSGDQRAAGLLLGLLTDPSLEVREAAVLRLGEIADERSLPSLEPLTRDPTGAEHVRAFALAAVERIRGRG
ncbi:MAG TPA: HEAT repeat domain-containing protein [Ktedonobacterales bacterium]|nr:HEAT repeat domain-containing protein [Ktedonobacterales bacterium]